MVTGSLVLGLAEVVLHGAIDVAKCGGRISYTTDQGMHVACKVVWSVLA